MNKPDWVSPCGTAELWNRDCREVVAGLQLDGVWSLVTDPPYGMAFISNHRAEKHRAITGDTETELLKWSCGINATHSRYVFCRWNNLKDVPPPKSLIHWVKNNWSMGDLQHEHARQTEQILFYPGVCHVFEDGRPTDVVFADRTGNDYHPSEKPVDLMVKVVKWTSGTVLDPFMGAGATGLACVRLNRRFIGIEIDPVYFDLAKLRIVEELNRMALFDHGSKKNAVKQLAFASLSEPIP